MDIPEIKKIKDEIEKEIKDFIQLKLDEFESKTKIYCDLIASKYSNSICVTINPKIWD